MRAKKKRTDSARARTSALSENGAECNVGERDGEKERVEKRKGVGDIAPGMIDARSGAADSRRRRRRRRRFPLKVWWSMPGVTFRLNTVTLRTENNGRDAETT